MSTIKYHSISKVRRKFDLVVVLVVVRHSQSESTYETKDNQMALETATTINQFVATNPVATDGLAEADDHLRLIKSTIKSTLPNVTGLITATHTEINTSADGDTATTPTTLVDADSVVVNDDGTMGQVAMSDVNTYIDSNSVSSQHKSKTQQSLRQIQLITQLKLLN